MPRSVITEAVVNAVAHRDYRNTGFAQVIVYADRIEVWNPGELPFEIWLDWLKKAFSDEKAQAGGVATS